MNEETIARVRELEKNIAELNKQGKFADAIPPARDVHTIRTNAQGEDWWETADARRNLRTLERIASLSAAAQQELAGVNQAEDRIEPLYRKGAFAELIQLTGRQLEIREKWLGSDHELLAGPLNDLGVFHRMAGAYADAEKHYRRGLQIARNSLGDLHPSVAETADNLGKLLRILSRYSEAEPLIREALAIRCRLLDEHHPSVANSLDNLASFLQETGDFVQSERLFRQALSVRRASTEQSPLLGTSLNNLAGLIQDKGDYEQAGRMFAEAIEVYRETLGPDHAWLLAARKNFALLLALRGHLTEAESLLRENVAVCERLNLQKNPELASNLRDLAYTLLRRGKYEEAEAHCRRALELQREHRRGAEKEEALALNALGAAQRFSGHYLEAEKTLREALAIAQRIMPNGHPALQPYWTYLGMTLLDQGKTAEAEACFQGALTDLKEQSPGAAPARAIGLHYLAAALQQKGDEDGVAEAEAHLTEAIAVWRSLGDARGYESGVLLGRMYLENRSMPTEAARAFGEAIEQLEWLRTQVAGDQLDRARHFTQLSKADAFGGMMRAQLALANHPSTGSDRQDHFAAAFDYLERGRGRTLLELLDRHGGNLYDHVVAEADRARDDALRAEADRRRLEELDSRELIKTVNRQMEAVRKEQGLAEENRAERLHKLIAEREQGATAERQAVSRVFELARDRLAAGKLKSLTAQDLASALDPDELLLIYDIGSRDSVLLVIRGKARGQSSNSANEPFVEAFSLKWPDGRNVDLPTLAATIGAVLADAAQGLSIVPQFAKGTSAYSSSDLGVSLIPDKLRSAIVSARQVFIAADGPLHRLPFEMLVIDGASHRQWIDVAPPIIYGPSATVLMNRRMTATARRDRADLAPQLTLVAVGDPQFTREIPEHGNDVNVTSSIPTGPQSPSIAMACGELEKELPSLPGTRAEVEAIAGYIRSSADDRQVAARILLGEEATLGNLYRAVHRPRLLHLATHALPLSGDRVGESALVFTPTADSKEPNDGFLRLNDLLTTWGGKLEGTEVVTLSACRTALGKMEEGEGFVALTWGFLYAGADSVVASLWKVDDKATSLLMSRFYANLLGAVDEPRTIGNRRFAQGERVPKALALRESKQWLKSLTRDQIEQLAGRLDEVPRSRGAVYASSESRMGRSTERPYEDPFYWAAFILIGDGS